MQISALVDEARAALREADPLCVEGNQWVLELRQCVEEATLQRAKILFLHDAQQDQLQNMGNLYVLFSHSVEQVVKESTLHTKRLRKSTQDLDQLLVGLRGVKLEAFRSGDEPARTLYSFVHEEDLQALQSQAAGLLEELKLSGNDMSALPQRLQKDIGALRDRQPKMETDVRNVQTVLADLGEEATTRAQSMAELLVSLTQHYDQACEAETLQSPEELEEALDILERDRLELDPAVHTVQKDHEALGSYRTAAQTHRARLESTFEETEAFFRKMDTLTMHSFRDYVDLMVFKQREWQERFRMVETLVAELDGLTAYYKQFQRAYNALLLEMIRRRKVQGHMEKTIAAMNATLQEEFTKESNARSEFIRNHGQYLPTDIWGHLYTMPTRYSLSFEDEPLPAIDESNIASALRGLK